MILLFSCSRSFVGSLQMMVFEFVIRFDGLLDWFAWFTNSPRAQVPLSVFIRTEDVLLPVVVLICVVSSIVSAA